jgi:hypothetical protein
MNRKLYEENKTLADVQALKSPTKLYWCPLSANNLFKIQFLNFRIRDINSKTILFNIERDPIPEEDLVFEDDDPDQDEYRSVK